MFNKYDNRVNDILNNEKEELLLEKDKLEEYEAISEDDINNLFNFL